MVVPSPQTLLSIGSRAITKCFGVFSMVTASAYETLLPIYYDRNMPMCLNA